MLQNTGAGRVALRVLDFLNPKSGETNRQDNCLVLSREWGNGSL